MKAVKYTSRSIIDLNQDLNGLSEEATNSHISHQSIIKIDNNISVISKDSEATSRRNRNEENQKKSSRNINEVRVLATKKNNSKAFSYDRNPNFSKNLHKKLDLFMNNEPNDCDTEEKNLEVPVSVRNSLLWNENPLLSPYLTNEIKELGQIKESTGEHFPTDSFGDTFNNMSKQVPSYCLEFGNTYKEYLENIGSQESVISESAANYKSNSSNEEYLSTIKSFHNRKACEYFGK
jgi:hypothetical protein